jgi:hypothetical protein
MSKEISGDPTPAIQLAKKAVSQHGRHRNFVNLFGVWIPIITIIVACSSCPKGVILTMINPTLQTLAEFTPITSAMAAHNQVPGSSPQEVEAPQRLQGASSGTIGPQADDSTFVQGVSTTGVLKGASSGTIGPQMDDTTYVSNVNTAGTVRVNNMATVEALLTIIANLLEIGFVCIGAAFLFVAIFKKERPLKLLGKEIEPMHFLIVGVLIILFGLVIPGTFNWVLASARDANLFS